VFSANRRRLANGAIHKGRKQRDPRKNDLIGVEPGHLWFSQLPASAAGRGITAQRVTLSAAHAALREYAKMAVLRASAM
jgi:hypothetical protein